MSKSNSPFLAGMSGTLAGEFVIKQYSYGTVVAKRPYRSPSKKPSDVQALRQGWFTEAIAYAQSIVRDKKKKAEWAKRLPKGKQVYHAAIKQFMMEKGELVGK